MGMFDTVRSSYDLGPDYRNKVLQTKDLDCLMSEYWIDPSGRLFEIDISHTADFIELQPGDDGYNSEDRLALFNFIWKPNGNHGKVKPTYIFKVVELYPSLFDGDYSNWPRCHVYFKDGVITEVRHL